MTFSPLDLLRRATDATIEGAIVPSFTSVGYRARRAMWGWEPLEQTSLAGRVAVVTGANSGLGFETAAWLATLGATVELVVRDRRRGTDAATALRRRTGSQLFEVRVADVSDLDAVRSLGDELVAAHDGIDVLIHNAGAINVERTESRQGIEATLATMVVGPQLLTHRLLDRLDTAAGRVIWVTSGGMYSTALHLDDLAFLDRYNGTQAYARAKRAQVDLVSEWAVRHPGPTTFAATHPGWADTPGVQSSLPTFAKVLGPVLRTPAEGVDTTVWLASGAGGPGRSGELWFDRRPRAVARLPRTATSPEDRDRLWAAVEELTAR